jgi:hypothetical protein
MKRGKQKLDWKLIGASEHMGFLKQEIEYVAEKIKTLDMAVLIMGPSGTGKELIAKAIAEQSGLKLITINCGAIPSELFESELFGHKKGAFTGAFFDKKGLVEEAENGILFLDEIRDLALHHQAKFLRFLQDKKFYRVGETTQRTAKNIKIIAATNMDLGKEVKEGRFREDLFYRLNHRIIETIPLKNRRIDIICLVNHFVHGNNIKIDPKVKLLLYSYNFPGNVRELESLIYSSDDFQYIKNALRNNVVSSFGVDLAFISQFKSLDEFHRGINMQDFLNIAKKQRRFKTPTEDIDKEEVSGPERLLRNEDAYNFLAATFYAEENECSRIVEAYEILTLKLCPGLTRDEIANQLHIRPEKLSPNGFKNNYGFDFSIKDNTFSYTEPTKLFPDFSNYWAHILRNKSLNQ